MEGRFNLQLNSASSGDTIEVDSGTYLECLDPNGKDIDIVGTGTVLINGSSCKGQLLQSQTPKQSMFRMFNSRIQMDLYLVLVRLLRLT